MAINDRPYLDHSLTILCTVTLITGQQLWQQQQQQPWTTHPTNCRL